MKMKLTMKDGREVEPSAKIGWAFIAGGFVFAAIGIWHLTTTYGFTRDTLRVPAVVLENSESCGYSEKCTYKPTFAVTTPDGETRQMRTQVGSSEYGFEEGSEMQVLYNPSYDHVRIEGFWNMWLLGGFCALLGLPIMIMGALVLREARRRQKTG